MLQAKVRGFRGCERADIEIDPISLLAGLNGAGKSSICQAIAAAATSQPIPFFNSSRPDKPRFTKADSKGLLRGGMDMGTCVLSVDGAQVSTILWPMLTASGTGAMQCSLVAAGLVNPMEMDEVDRQRYFSTLLNADPTSKRSQKEPEKLTDLEEALIEAMPALADEDNAEALKSVIDNVNTNGWDVAHKHYKERGARRKGEWEGRAGESFGLKKAIDWKPQGWRDDLADKTLEDLGTACTHAQQALEKAVAAVATDAANLAQLVEQANGEADAWNALKEAETALQDARADLTAKETQRQAIGIPTAIPCPHCGGLVDVVEGKHDLALKQSMATTKEIETAKKAFEAAGLLVKQAMATAETRQAAYNSARGAYEAKKGSTERLADAKKRTGTSESVDLARDYLASVTKDKEMVEKREACAVLAGQIQANQKLVDILSPEGLRRQKLQRALAQFNKNALGALSGEAEYSTVTIDDGLEILYGGRKYFLLSASEQYRVRAVVQTAVALYDNSPLVILDGADILDQEGRNGLFSMMQAATTKISFIVGMTVLSKKNVPDLAKPEIGKSYWVDAGIAAPLGE